MSSVANGKSSRQTQTEEVPTGGMIGAEWLSTDDESALGFTRSLVGGDWVEAREGAKLPVEDPANGEVIAMVGDLSRSDISRAVEAASDAFPKWSAVSCKRRAEILHKWFSLMAERREVLARTMARENGKPYAEALGEMAYAGAFVEWFAEEARRSYGETIPTPVSDKRLLTIKQPVGVCGMITPWNFPAAMITRKVAAALAAGCTCVVKPSELTPLTALALAKLAEEAGVPPGVINVVVTSDAKAAGDVLCGDPRVKKISFTGSTRVGKLLARQAQENVKRVSLELGGNAPFIVFEDADIEEAVNGLMASKFRGSGQTCVCANRIFVHKNIFLDFTMKLVQAVEKLKLGHGLTEGTTTGPLINAAAVRKVQDMVDDAVAKGAQLLTGGSSIQLAAWADGRRKEGAGTKGHFFEPTVIDMREVPRDSGCRLLNEEIFGPVAPLFSFEDSQEVIQKANETNSGLAAYFFTSNVHRVFGVSEALQSGMVGVNTGIVSHVEAPFGGVKESGVGREGSKHGIDEYLQLKYICMGSMKAEVP